MEEAEYRKLAAVEDRMWYFASLHALIERVLQARLGARPAQILDAGCGTGGLIARLGPLHPAWAWTGVDVSSLACALARERWSAPLRQGFGGRAEPALPRIVEANITALPFPPASFDAVVSADVLYHVADDRAALQEFRRVLRPGGVLILNLPAHPWLWSYHDVAVGGLRRYRRSGLGRQLRSADFSSVRLTHWNTLLLPLIAFRRKCLPAPAGGSDVQEFSLPLELLGRAATALERGWLDLAPLPFGSSLLAVAR
jgi:SAM-dependent methyltransferase